MIRYLRFCLAPTIAFLGACGGSRDDVPTAPVASREALRAEAVGCWQLFNQSGQSPPDAYWAPTYVQLDSALAGAGYEAGVRLAHRFDSKWAALPLNMEPGINGLNTWRADQDSDSIRIVFNNMFSGLEFVSSAATIAVCDGALRATGGRSS